MNHQIECFECFESQAVGCPHGAPPTRRGTPRHPHSRPCPCCGRWTAPYDDTPWHEGGEWTSAHNCHRCRVLWTHGWAYPTGAADETDPPRQENTP